MGFISLLPESVFNKIAAGEVVERPSSVVKELVENSVDACASIIKISIEKSGLKSITVIDNGCGMDDDDAILCFEPHATSKIKSEEEIFRISTMGFRGEAMPSIASVSKVRLKTKRHSSIEGVEVIVNGGKFLSQNPVGCACGTELTVSDLFFNVPARKKFIKGEITEEKHIYETVLLLAMANTKISFEFKVDGKTVFNSTGDTNLLPRLSLLSGREIANNSLELKKSRDNYEIHGYISKPSVTRNTRREQRFFVNKRPIRSLVLSSAVREGYGAHIMHGYYPAVTVFLEVPVSEVDVNVHPAKHEVRFRNESLVSNILAEGIREILNASIQPAASVSISRLPISSVIDSSQITYLKTEKPVEPSLIVIHSEKSLMPGTKTESEENMAAFPQSNNEKTALKLPGCGYLKIIDILNKTYILALSDIGLVIIDQHAAHERIIFERLLKDYSVSKMRQELLIPVTIELSRPEINLMKKLIGLISALGFGIDFFGDTTVLVHSVPEAIRKDNISGLISNILNSIIESNKSGSKIDETEIARIACSLAVKANDNLSFPEAQKLVSDLSVCDLPFNCPHGRPTVINISIKELEKRFGRSF
ncbi:MAG TPA: DNA mismatch repair endonuclease MutL [Lentisphaeria bacterium]|nr:MAG: hypothetical protein A2X47_00880 [Lentisphaerae bacterium GWF2_38_69]HBM17514.1 DNA mismatch repair endonuclease MutL [Lentisphaeria bacterium]